MEHKKEIGHTVNRLPGQSLRERRSEKWDDSAFFAFGFLAVGITYLTLECCHVYGGLKPNIWLGICVFLASVAFAIWSLYRVRYWMRAFRLGERGERIVAQRLHRDLCPLGYVVFHDIPIRKDGRDFNIDHLIIGTNGIFVVETKNYTKPPKGRVEVLYDGKRVLWNGVRRKDEDKQAMAIANAAKELIDDITGLRVFVTPVLCAVGWYTTSTNLFGNPVILCMEKTLKSIIPKVQARITLKDSERNKIIAALDRLQ